MVRMSQVTEYMVANLLQYEVIDAALERFFGFLREEGLYQQTTIIYTADHGEMNCNLGLLDKGAFLNPHVLRVLLVVKPSPIAAGHFATGRCDAPVSLIDIAPTVCELGGVSPEDRLDGVPLQRSVIDKPRPADRPIIAEVWSHVVPNPCVATVVEAADGRRYLFSFNICDDLSELYQLADSGDGGAELENLFGSSDYAEQTEQAIEVLHARLSRDERWKGYHAYSSLIFARYLNETGDMQRFQWQLLTGPYGRRAGIPAQNNRPVCSSGRRPIDVIILYIMPFVMFIDRALGRA